MMEEPALAQLVGDRFDHILVDEYQDTNALQAQILLRMKSDGRGLTVVGERRAVDLFLPGCDGAEHRGFPESVHPTARVVTLEQNYRSTEPPW